MNVTVRVLPLKVHAAAGELATSHTPLLIQLTASFNFRPVITAASMSVGHDTEEEVKVRVRATDRAVAATSAEGGVC